MGKNIGWSFRRLTVITGLVWILGTSVLLGSLWAYVSYSPPNDSIGLVFPYYLEDHYDQGPFSVGYNETLDGTVTAETPNVNYTIQPFVYFVFKKIRLEGSIVTLLLWDPFLDNTVFEVTPIQGMEGAIYKLGYCVYTPDWYLIISIQRVSADANFTFLVTTLTSSRYSPLPPSPTLLTSLILGCTGGILLLTGIFSLRIITRKFQEIS